MESLYQDHTYGTYGFYDQDYPVELSVDNFINVNATPSCVLGLLPCSITITGNLVLIIFYGALLGVAAKVISDVLYVLTHTPNIVRIVEHFLVSERDGAEMLLDLGLPATLIGGIVLPLLGAVPDSAMIIASGIGGSKDHANKQIAVGMGTLAGSTIMLLTLPWLGSIILGRVDIVHGQGIDGVTKKFTIMSFLKQGVSVFPDVTYSAIIMLVSALPYLIVQGADWHWGPTKQQNATTNSTSGQPPYIKGSALATSVLSFFLFICYLVLQIFYSVSSKRRDEQRRLEIVKRRVIRQMYMTTLGKFQSRGGGTTAADTTGTVQTSGDEAKPLLSAGKQKQYLGAWRNYRSPAQAPGSEDGKKEENASEHKEKNEEDPKWLIAVKSAVYLIVGVGMVTVFSDPMVSALAALTDQQNTKYVSPGSGPFTKGQHIPIGVFYISFVVTPFCSNASELVSSLMFAAKKTKTNSSLTFSQLYGAATMNNTLGLGIFTALVYFRDLEWQYSAEVSVILFVEFTIGIAVIIAGFGYKHTYILLMGIFIGFMYFFSILLIWMLEHFAKWK